MNISPNPVVYFEIPVTNMERAQRFYETVFDVAFEKEVIDGNDMALFPFSENQTGITGALAKGDSYRPGREGTLVYFGTDQIDDVLVKAQQNGGAVLYPKTANEYGYVAEFEDTEGNRIGLFMKTE
ncbi:VOC family protein [Ascidiimonas aurantiaca]|uniref:VOC family protein n=1 Tax=Ascidiimonas aurantiaca TaxID=1685432 RepID=UPI0030EC1A4E